jgi:hypothetical protein
MESTLMNEKGYKQYHILRTIFGKRDLPLSFLAPLQTLKCIAAAKAWLQAQYEVAGSKQGANLLVAIA